MFRSTAFDMFAAVQDEYRAAQFAIQTTRSVLGQDRVLRQAVALGINESLLTRCADTLESTFVLRLFSIFESVLRDYWRHGVGRQTEPDMRPLMSSIAARRKVSGSELAAAHQIREYRNDIVHENLRAASYRLADCSRALARFIARLPLEW